MSDLTLREKFKSTVNRWEAEASQDEEMANTPTVKDKIYYTASCDVKRNCAKQIEELLMSEEKRQIVILEYVGEGVGEYRIVSSLELSGADRDLSILS